MYYVEWPRFLAEQATNLAKWSSWGANRHGPGPTETAACCGAFPPDDVFRSVELEIDRKDLTVKTLSGYYP